MNYELYNTRTINYQDQEVGYMYYGEKLLWRKKANAKYTFSFANEAKYYIYNLNKAKLYKHDSDKKLDRIFIEYQNYNVLNSIKVINNDLENCENNIVYGELFEISSDIQINPKTEEKFIIENKSIVVYDKFNNKLGNISIPTNKEIKHILLDYNNNSIYAFIEKNFDGISIYKYSYVREVIKNVQNKI